MTFVLNKIRKNSIDIYDHYRYLGFISRRKKVHKLLYTSRYEIRKTKKLANLHSLITAKDYTLDKIDMHYCLY